MYNTLKDGRVKVGDHIKFIQANSIYEVTEVGVKTPNEIKKDSM